MKARRFLIGVVALSVLGMAAGSSRASIDPETIVGIWLFDEGGGDVATDSSKNANDGTLLPADSGPQWTTQSKFGGALEFSGQSVYIEFPTGESMKTPHFTIMAWFNTRKLDGYGHIFQTGRDWDDMAGYVIRVHQDGTVQAGLAFGPGNVTAFVTGPTIDDDTWYHIALSYDGTTAIVYLDGAAVATGAGQGEIMYDDQPVRIGVHSQDTGAAFDGFLDDVALFDVALEADDIQSIMDTGLAEIVGGPSTAVKPEPPNGQTDVPRDLVLSWTPGEFAATHNVYFDDNFADVNSGAPGTLIGDGIVETSVAREHLAFGTTYFWRVDEVNAPPDSTVFPGPIWSFTVEPYTYPIQSVTATASSAVPAKGMTPDKTVDGSGMTGDEHSTDEDAMWLSDPAAPLPAWIQYEFDDVYKLSELWVWNSNQAVEGFIGFGARDVTVEYSLDGVEWNSLGDVEFAQAPGDVGYTHNTVVDLAGVQAKFVRLTIATNWRNIVQQAGLSEVRFFHIPVKARQPDPASGDIGVPLDATLTWRVGREASSHDVYFSDDRQAVVDGTAPMETVGETRFGPSGLEYGQVYYWKVNEVNDADGATVEGDIWSFSTIEYRVVDDFESYTDDIEAGATIWQTWLDGLTNNTGSVVGYWEAPFAETRIVHSGGQSMPMDYNNVSSPFLSEAERTFDPVQDWTANGATELVLWYRGYPVAFIENADGSIVMNGSGHDIWDAADDFRFAYQPLNGDGSIVARVDSIGNTDPWAKAGVMIRESLSDDARCVYMVVTPASGVSFQWRRFIGVTPESVTEAGIVAPQYVKLTRTGDVFTAQYSADGSAWQDLTAADGAPVSISMGSNPLIGLCVTSHNASLVTTAEFSAITSSGTGPWQVAAVGDDPQPGNDAEDLYVVIRDSGNRIAVVTNPDPAAVNASEWAEWKIPLSEFTSAGVKMTAVKTITIGVGNNAAPTAGGAGTLYIDDIGYGRSLP